MTELEFPKLQEVSMNLTPSPDFYNFIADSEDTRYSRGGHGSVYISKVSHFTFVWLVSKNLGHG